MIKTIDLHPRRYSYIEGLKVTENENGYTLSSCLNFEVGFDEPFQMDVVEFDVMPDSERDVAYGLHIYLVKETRKMEYKLFRRLADQDGYNYDFIESNEDFLLMKNILSVTIYPNGEKEATFYNHQKELEQ
ncbi:hypothetical protein [Bacillus sp. RHFS10]|uniref:hypothetical protein n=1 Tax=Bacillus sp. RHFS10 TaxID=2804501 RepID=UPI0019297474|nr:hypothetical protein [Bacillus sp. RHFS10]MBL3648446.1 hypothetical protein [Bacillus sp. RHFS10]